jgi:N-acetyl-alpha-D-glucosaminyl L-malate synthase BshA
MKIGMVCYPTYGGSGAVATELGIYLAERGHEVHFISYTQPFRLAHFRERVFFHEVEMEQYPLFEHPPYSLALAVAIHDMALKHDLDLVHVHYAIPHATSAWIAREMLPEGRDLPIVTSLHGTDITLVGLHPSFQAITQFSLQQSDGLITPSEFLQEVTARDFGVSADSIRVINNFVDVEVFRRGKEPCHRSSLAPGGEKIVMHISNFREVKRVPDVVEVFARISETVPARLILVGDGPERPRVVQRVEDLGVGGKVLFLGKHQSVDELLPCADLFLMPSRLEAFGLAILEALSCGAPVIATRAGGIPEVVADGEAGFLFPVGAVEEMAEVGTRLLTDDAFWQRTSEAARAIAVERFSHEPIITRYEEYYRETIDARKRA